MVSSTNAQDSVKGQEGHLQLSQAYEELVQDASAMIPPALPNFEEHLSFLKNTLDGFLAHLAYATNPEGPAGLATTMPVL